MSPFFFVTSMTALYAVVFNLDVVLALLRRMARKVMPSRHSIRQGARRKNRAALAGCAGRGR